MEFEETKLLKIQDIQELLKISRTKAYELIKQNGFPVIRIGKSIRVIKKELLNWLHNNQGQYIIKTNLRAETC